MPQQGNNNMEEIIVQLVGLYRTQGEDAVREQLKSADLPDEEVDVFIAKVKRRIQAEDTPQDDEAEKMMKLITADYLQNGEAVVCARLKDSGMDDEMVDQIITDVKLLAQVEMRQSLKQMLESDGEDAVRQTLKQQGTDDATIEKVLQELRGVA